MAEPARPDITGTEIASILAQLDVVVERLETVYQQLVPLLNAARVDDDEGRLPDAG